MKDRHWGRIVNIGSQSAVKGMPLTGAYCASKVAVHMLTRAIALENGNGITCNAVLPGIIDTPANRKQMPDADHRHWVQPENIAKKIEQIIVSEENGALIDI